MAKLLPPLNALRAFEATARHESFSRAADELNVTPAALSHQVAGLESFLGERLFNRNARSISLTPAGEVLYPASMRRFSRSASPSSVCSTPSTARSWWSARRRDSPQNGWRRGSTTS